MKKIYFLFTLLITALSYGQATDLYFSMYGEGSSNNKFIEIYNGTGATVDLADYSVELYSNGATTATTTGTQTFPAMTMLASGDVYVLRNGSASLVEITNAADISSGTCNFNGDDAIALKKLGVVIDVIGSIGNDPGTSWPVGSTSDGTLNHTIVRKITVCSPNAVNLSSFGTDDSTSEWIVYPIDGELGQLGSHVGCSSSPSLSISSPSNGALLNPLTTSVDVAFTVANFSVANGTGDGHITYSINGGTAIDKFDTTDITIPVAQGQSYSVAMELVDNTGASLSTPVTANVVFSVDIIYVMSDLASLRADVITNGAGRYYEITGNPVITYARDNSNRNQKYIQDATAGILIDDNAGTITTSMVIGDAIAGLRGQTSIFNGVLQLLPIENATVFSSSNIITPQIVTITDILGDIEAYESELVQINNATFTTADGIIAFATSQNYNLNDGSDIVFRTLFSEADYIGQIVPSGAANRVVLVAEFNGTAQVVARDLSDITLSTKSFNAIEGLTMYPNPLSGNTLNFSSTANTDMTVQVYNILGKEVAKGNVINNTFNTGNLNAGIYIVKVTEEGKTATRKLVVK